MSSKEKKLESIIDQIIKYAHLDFDEKVNFNLYKDTEFEALAIGINMLGEELQDRIISREYLEKIISSLNEMLFTLSPDRKIKTINMSVEKNLGYTFDELMNRTFEDIVKNTADKFSSIQYLITKDQDEIPAIISESNLYDNNGEIFEIIIVAKDIIDLKNAENELKKTTSQLIQSEKLSALGELSASVAHELNQPLNAINIISQSSIRNIKKNDFDIDEIADSFSDILLQVKKMSEIIDHMRIFTRNADKDLTEEININDICNSSLKFFRQQLSVHNIKLTEECASGIPLIRGNAVNIEQVFLNILTNARNALDDSEIDDKSIIIKSYLVKSRDSLLNRDSVVVEILNNGPEIPDDLKKSIFEPFFTTKSAGKGTGLGLSISNKIINEHRGKLILSDEKEGWTIFKIILPVMRDQ